MELKPWLQIVWTLSMLVALSVQHKCEQCDCTVSGSEVDRGVHLTTLTCMDGSVTWYNPTGALRLELRPERGGDFRTCFVVESKDVALRIAKEVELDINSKSPTQRSRFMMNDNNLKTIATMKGKSKEICIHVTNSVLLYLEPELSGNLSQNTIVFRYDTTNSPEVDTSSIEECRPCSEAEILRAYCSSDFVVVGSMESVRHVDELEKTKIEMAVSQLIRQTGSHFNRPERNSALKGTIFAPRKCGIVKGDGIFLMTGRVRLGELTMGCAPYLDEWESIVNRAELEGRMECTRD